MWYSTDSGSFNIKGYHNGSLLQTTYGNYGYNAYLMVDSSESSALSFTSNNSPYTYQGVQITQVLSFVSGGNYVKIEYIVKNTTSSSKSISLGVDADIQIGSNDYAPIENLPGNRGVRMYNGSSQFMFIGRDSYGVTNVDTYWFGDYDIRTQNRYTNSTTYYYGSGSRRGDSGMAWSWKNRTIGAGQTQTYSVLIGIGELNDPPTISLTSTFKNFYYENEEVLITGRVNDINTGDRVTVKYAVDNGTEYEIPQVFTPNGVAKNFSATFRIPSSLSAGVHNLKVWAVDDKGNMSIPATANFTVAVDATAPTGSYTLTPSTWTSGSVTINVTGTDGQSGMQRIKLPSGSYVNSSTGSYTVSSNGTYTFVLEDKVGNTNQYKVTVTNIDKVAPTITLSGTPTSWTKGNVAISASASDSGIGVYRIKLPDGNYVNNSQTTYVVSSNGTYTFEAEDHLGNKSSKSISITNIDETPPSKPSISANTNWTNASAVPVTIIGGTDSQSGVNRSEYKLEGATVQNWTTYTGVFNITKEGITKISARTVDNLGHISEVVTLEVKIDRVAPHATSIQINNDAEYTNSRTVTLSLSALDNASGVAQMQFKNEDGSWSTAEAYKTSKSWTLSTGDAVKTVWVRYKDNAGNWSDPVSDTIKLDTTAPTVSKFVIQDDKPYYNSHSVYLNLKITDAFSGIKEVYISNNNSTWTTFAYAEKINWTLTSGDGNKTVYMKVLDIAGNMSSVVSDTIFIDTVKPTGSIVINNGDEQTMSRDVKIKITFSDNSGGSGIKTVKVIEGDKEYTFPTVPTSPVTIDWRLEEGTGMKTVNVILIDKAGNVSNTISDSIIVDKLSIEKFTLTDVVNPIKFNNKTPFTPKVWDFSPQPMLAGGNISFAVDLKTPYDASVVEDSVLYKVEIIGGSYHKALTGQIGLQSKDHYSKTVTIPEDAPEGAKVYVTVTAKRQLLVSPHDLQVVYFPGVEATTKAQIGVVDGNIHEQVKFNEIY